MSNLWINIRFGARHLQIGRRGVTFALNPYWLANKPAKWCEVYEFFGLERANDR